MRVAAGTAIEPATIAAALAPSAACVAMEAPASVVASPVYASVVESGSRSCGPRLVESAVVAGFATKGRWRLGAA